MSRGTTRSRRFLEMPKWLTDSMTAIGLSTVIYVLVRYTFVGEILERVYANALGRSPMDEIEYDLKSAGNAIATDLRSVAREMNSQNI